MEMVTWKEFQTLYQKDQQALLEAKGFLKEELVLLQENQTLQTKQQLDQWEAFRSQLEQLFQIKSSHQVIQELNQLTEELERLHYAKDYLEVLITIEQGKEHIKKNIEIADFNHIEEAIEALRDLINISNMSTFKWTSLTQSYYQSCVNWSKEAIEGQLGQKLLSQCGSDLVQTIQHSDQLELILQIVDLFTLFSSIVGDKNVYERLAKWLSMPLAARFHFHFSSNRPTNRVDKPEWWLNHLIQILEGQIPILEEYFELEFDDDDDNGNDDDDDDDDDDERESRDLTHSHHDHGTLRVAFASAILQLANDKLRDNVVSRIKDDPELLLHTVDELNSFQNRLYSNLNLPLSIVEGPLYSLFTLNYDETTFIYDRWLELQGEAIMATLRGIFAEHPNGWDEELEIKNPKASLMDKVITLIGEQATVLHVLPTNRVDWKVQFLQTVMRPPLEFIYDRLDFDIPAFHNTLQDIRIIIAQTRALVLFLRRIRDDWGESVESIALASHPQYQELVEQGHEAAGRPGTIFYRTVESFEGNLLEGRLKPALHDYVWEAFSGPAATFARAMHYAVTRPPGTTFIGMHDELRRAMLDFCSAYNFVVGGLSTPITTAIAENAKTVVFSLQLEWLGDFAHFFYNRVILQNYFREEWSERVRTDFEQLMNMLKALMPEQPVERILSKVREAIRVITLPEDQRHQLQVAIDMMSEEQGDEDLQTAISLLEGQLGIQLLSISECEILVKLIK